MIITCPQCRTKNRVPDQLIPGGKYKCGKCHEYLTEHINEEADNSRTGVGVLFNWEAIGGEGAKAWQVFCESCDPKNIVENIVLMTDVWSEACKIEIKALSNRQHAFCVALPDARSEQVNYVHNALLLNASKFLLSEMPFVPPYLLGPWGSPIGRINFEGVFTLYDGDFLWVLLRAAKAKWNCSVSANELNRFLRAVRSCSDVADDEIAIYAHAIGAHRLDQALADFRSDYIRSLTHWSEDKRPTRQKECEELIARLKRAIDIPKQTKEEACKSETGEYSLLQLSTSIFMNTPSSSDDDQLVKQAYSLMQNKRWGEAKKIIQEGLKTCNRKDRLCELIANIYLNEKNPLAIGWYMQSCLLGSPSWVPYLLVSYAARALAFDGIAWRCLNACDVIDTGMKRIDKLQTDIAEVVRNSNQSQLVAALKNFEKEMDSYLPSSDEIPHEHNEREIFLGLNLSADIEEPPLKQLLRLISRNKSSESSAFVSQAPPQSNTTKDYVTFIKCNYCNNIIGDKPFTMLLPCKCEKFTHEVLSIDVDKSLGLMLLHNEPYCGKKIYIPPTIWCPVCRQNLVPNWISLVVYENPSEIAEEMTDPRLKAMRKIARELIDKHGKLIEVHCLASRHSNHIELLFANGHHITIKEHLGGINITMLKYGYAGTGPKCFYTFLNEAGFDVSYEEIIKMKDGTILRH